MSRLTHMPTMPTNEVEFDFTLDYDPSVLTPFGVGDFVPNSVCDQFGNFHRFDGDGFVVAERLARRSVLDVRRLFVRVFSSGRKAVREDHATAA